MHADEDLRPVSIQIYGSSGSSVNKSIESIMGVSTSSPSIYSNETGHVAVISEPTWGCVDIGGPGWGQEAVYCIIVLLVIAAVYVLIWAVVMLVYSIFTFGGFVKRRYRTLLLIQILDTTFLGKLSMAITTQEGVMNYPLDDHEYNAWISSTFGLHSQLKYIRQLSLLLACFWGIIEAGFKINQILFTPDIDYNLWPLRLVMLAIFLPMIFYSVILEIRIRSAFDTGQSLSANMIVVNPALNPESPMVFEAHPYESDMRLRP